MRWTNGNNRNKTLNIRCQPSASIPVLCVLAAIPPPSLAPSDLDIAFGRIPFSGAFALHDTYLCFWLSLSPFISDTVLLLLAACSNRKNMLTADTLENGKWGERAREEHNGIRSSKNVFSRLNERNEPILLFHLNFSHYRSFSWHFFIPSLFASSLSSSISQMCMLSRWVCNSFIESRAKYFIFFFVGNEMCYKHQRNEIQWIFTVSCLKSNWKSLIHKSMCFFYSFLSFVVIHSFVRSLINFILSISHRRRIPPPQPLRKSMRTRGRETWKWRVRHTH